MKRQWSGTATIKLSRIVTKPTKWHVRQAKPQISLGIRPVWSESSLSARRKLGYLATNWAHSEDSDQTGWMPRLIWVFAERTCHFVGFVTMRLKFNSKMNKIELDLIVLVPDHCLCIYFVNNYSYSGLFNVFRYINEKNHWKHLQFLLDHQFQNCLVLKS